MRNFIVPPENTIAKEIPGFPGYWATDDGRIWSGRRAGGFLRTRIDRSGYYAARVRLGGKSTNRRVYYLVALAFMGDRQPAWLVRHIDGNRLNDAPSNLAYGTQMENRDDDFRLGVTKGGSRSFVARLNAAQVREIIECVAAGASFRDVARRYSVGGNAIQAIASGRGWKHIKRCPFAPVLRGMGRTLRHLK